MNPETLDSITRCAAIVEYLAVSLPELERSDLMTDQLAYAHYAMLSEVAGSLREIAVDRTLAVGSSPRGQHLFGFAATGRAKSYDGWRIASVPMVATCDRHFINSIAVLVCAFEASSGHRLRF